MPTYNHGVGGRGVGCVQNIFLYLLFVFADKLYRPCQHSWGPCANDHSYHHARSRPTSPWSPVSSSSSGSFHTDSRFKRIEWGKYNKKRWDLQPVRAAESNLVCFQSGVSRPS